MMPERSHANEEVVGYKQQRGTFWSLHHGHFPEDQTIQSTFFGNVMNDRGGGTFVV